MSKDYIHKARGVSELKAHLVLTTKYRRKVLSAPMLDCLEGVFGSTLQKWGGHLIEFNGEPDHVHLLFQYTPQAELSKLINNLKTVSSRKIRKEFSSQVAKFYSKPVFWNSSYFIASCGGVTVDQLKKYVESQDRPKQ